MSADLRFLSSICLLLSKDIPPFLSKTNLPKRYKNALPPAGGGSFLSMQADIAPLKGPIVYTLSTGADSRALHGTLSS